jgi:hypothetical protein
MFDMLLRSIFRRGDQVLAAIFQSVNPPDGNCKPRKSKMGYTKEKEEAEGSEDRRRQPESSLCELRLSLGFLLAGRNRK